MWSLVSVGPEFIPLFYNHSVVLVYMYSKECKIDFIAIRKIKTNKYKARQID